MTLAKLQSYYYRRTKTNSTSFPAADQVIALNNAHEYALDIIQDKTDNYIPTDWTTSDLSTGTVTPAFEAKYHRIIALHVAWQWATENDQKKAKGLERELVQLSRALGTFYGSRNYRIFTVTIAAPGVFTRTNHGLQTGERIIFSTSGALPTGLSANTWYFVYTASADTFEVSATIDGDSITTSGTQSGTQWFGKEKNAVMKMKKINYI